MLILIRHGLEMRLPAGKLPGFYAQIVKGIADRVPLLDRHRELLVFAEEAHLTPVRELLDHYRVPADPLVLYELPPERTTPGPLYEDYAIVTRSGGVFLDRATAAAFRLHAEEPDAEAAPALLQLEEHLIAAVDEPDSGDSVNAMHFIDRQLVELAERIARAYRCSIAVRPD